MDPELEYIQNLVEQACTPNNSNLAQVAMQNFRAYLDNHPDFEAKCQLAGTNRRINDILDGAITKYLGVQNPNVNANLQRYGATHLVWTTVPLNTYLAVLIYFDDVMKGAYALEPPDGNPAPALAGPFYWQLAPRQTAWSDDHGQ
jgi:hypothetical protein